MPASICTKELCRAYRGCPRACARYTCKSCFRAYKSAEHGPTELTGTELADVEAVLDCVQVDARLLSGGCKPAVPAPIRAKEPAELTQAVLELVPATSANPASEPTNQQRTGPLNSPGQSWGGRGGLAPQCRGCQAKTANAAVIQKASFETTAELQLVRQGQTACPLTGGCMCGMRHAAGWSPISLPVGLDCGSHRLQPERLPGP